MSIISAGGAVTGADVSTPFDPRDYFFTKTYTGNNTANAISGVGFQPDMLWIKPMPHKLLAMVFLMR
jgi:hypothetical protein